MDEGLSALLILSFFLIEEFVVRARFDPSLEIEDRAGISSDHLEDVSRRRGIDLLLRPGVALTGFVELLGERHRLALLGGGHRLVRQPAVRIADAILSAALEASERAVLAFDECFVTPKLMLASSGAAYAFPFPDAGRTI